jgi:DNA-binding response OmpR family regulator
VSKILVVDDSAMNRNILTGYLREGGFESAIATNGVEALEIVSEDPGKYPIALVDIHMPKLNGLELLKKIKEEPKLAGITVIMQTSSRSPEDINEGIKNGAYHYMTKPIDKNFLLSIVRAAFSQISHYENLRNRAEQNKLALNFMTSAEFEFQTIEEADILASSLSQLFPNPSSVTIGLSELFINAIEHGNLEIGYETKTKLLEANSLLEEIYVRLKNPKYASRYVNVIFSRIANEIVVEITDGGRGFNWKPFMELDPDRAFDNHGRGIALAAAKSFDNIEYKGCGNTVVAKTFG